MEEKYIHICRRMIEDRLEGLVNKPLGRKDFLFLIEDIYAKSGILLSQSTLRRLWDDEYSQGPQLKTLEALSQYLGYKNWSEFKFLNHQLVSETEKKIDFRRYRGSKFLGIYRNKRLAQKLSIGAALLSILSVSFIIMGNQFWSVHVKREFSFSTDSIAYAQVPVTVKFNYHLKTFPGDSLYIQLNSKKQTRKLVDPKVDNFFGVYLLPGLYHPKLILNGKKLAETTILLRTNGWRTYVHADNEVNNPTYINNPEIFSGGRMHITPGIIEKNNLKLHDNVHTINYVNFRDFKKVSGEDFSLETSIKNSSDEGALICEGSNIIVCMETGKINVPFGNSGYVGSLFVQTIDSVYRGTTSDLSAFGCDMSDWQKVKIVSRNKQLSIFRNQKLLKTYTFQKAPGSVLGLQFSFQGCGSVDYIKLYDSKDNIAYEEGF